VAENPQQEPSKSKLVELERRDDDNMSNFDNSEVADFERRLQ